MCGQIGHVGRPVGAVVAAGKRRVPGIGPALGAGQKVAGAKLVNAGAPDSQLRRRRGYREVAKAQFGKEMADKRGRKTTGELWFFITPPVSGDWIFRILADSVQG